MSKTSLGPRALIYPTPSVLVGANVNGQPNFMTAAWCGVVNSLPPMVSVSIQHHRHTHKGIRQNQTFSINLPSVDMVKETDYCGTVSGSKVNKVEVCRFKVFYGKLESAPLIEQCPVNLECQVVHMLNLGSHSLFVGKVEETFVSDDCMTDGNPDITKIRPISFIVAPTRQYYAIGEVVAKAFGVGLKLREK